MKRYFDRQDPSFRGLNFRGLGSRGLTLVEMLVVLAIMALVVGLVGPRVVDYFGRAKSTTAKLQIENLAAGLDLFRLDVGRYPTIQEGLPALAQRPAGLTAWKGPYIKGDAVPNDPWGRVYTYRIPGRDGRGFDLMSLGADGAPGGTGENQDITN
ncbi:MAG: type II secretion system protein GspG [Alphaproteobacteria bacterium]|nr:type II secretion system protein GspG [Alphaproteobacteria bacterium]